MDLKILKTVIDKECIALENLLNALDKQYRLVMKNNAIELELVVEEIKLCNKNIAELEVERRGILSGKSLNAIVLEDDDKDLEDSFRRAKKLVELLKLQKESNDLLIKQQLSYTNKMLRILNPDRQAKTYNSYGRMRK